LQFLEQRHSIPPPRAEDLGELGLDQYRINRLTKYGVRVTERQLSALHLIRKYGNKGSHAPENVRFHTKEHVEKALNYTRLIRDWLHTEYVNRSSPREEAPRQSTYVGEGTQPNTAGASSLAESFWFDGVDLPGQQVVEPIPSVAPETNRKEVAVRGGLAIRGLKVMLGGILIFVIGMVAFQNNKVAGLKPEPKEQTNSVAAPKIEPKEQVSANVVTLLATEVGPEKAELEAVVAAYKSALSPLMSMKVILGKTAVVGEFAIQIWQIDPMGGQALLKFDRAKRQWFLLRPGGGAWDLDGLVQVGVPRETASALLAKVSKKPNVYESSPSSADPPKASPNAPFSTLLALAKNGDPRGQNSVGVMYHMGWGTPLNDLEAAKWFRRGADQGYAASESWLGTMYRNGWGVPKNEIEARRLYKLAAEQGNMAAKSALADPLYNTRR